MFDHMQRRLAGIAVAASFAALLSGVSWAPAAAAAPAVSVEPQLLPTNIAGTQIYAAPPAGFNALTASDVALAAYGLPPRPNAIVNAKEYERWVDFISHANSVEANRTLTALPQVKFGPIQSARARGSSVTGSLFYSSNWSGVAETSPKKPFDLIYAYFTVPAVKPPNGAGCGQDYYLGNWVGLDGFSNSDVLQAGTFEFSLACASAYSAWYEWYPFSSVVTSLSILPGDGVVDEVWYTPSTKKGHAFLENYTTGKYLSITFSAPSGTVFAGSSAEWILEAPGVNGVQAAFANYGFGNFAYAEAEDTAGHYYTSDDTSTAVHNDIYGVQNNTIYSKESPIGPEALWFFYE